MAKVVQLAALLLLTPHRAYPYLLVPSAPTSSLSALLVLPLLFLLLPLSFDPAELLLLLLLPALPPCYLPVMTHLLFL